MVQQIAQRLRNHTCIDEVQIRQIGGDDAGTDHETPVRFAVPFARRGIRERDADERMGDVVQEGGWG